MREAAAACVDVLREVVAGLDPDAVLAAEAPDVWALFDQGEKLCSAAKLLVARKVEESWVWKEAGMRSAAEYLALRSGTTRQAAREALRSSERLTQLPHVEDALRRGELSAPQTHVIADAAAHDPTAQSALVDHAKVASFKELRDECLRRKVTADPKPEDTQARIQRDRYLRMSTDAEGAWRLSGRGPLHHASIFGATLTPLIDDQYKKARVEGKREEREKYAYDALQEMARLAHAAYYGYAPEPAHHEGQDGNVGSPDQDPVGGQTPGGGDFGGSGDGSEATSKPARRANPMRLPLIRMDLTALRRGWTEPGEICEIASSGAIPVSMARDLLGRSIVKLVISHHGQVANVVHIGNGVVAAERLGVPPSTSLQAEPPAAPSTHLALIHLDTRALHGQTGQCQGTCTIAGVGPVPLTAARELLGPPLLQVVLARGVAVAGYVHPGRQATVAQRMALLWAQPQCSVEGCPHTFSEIDHRADWAKTHVTRLDTLDRLCTHHHRLKTYQGWALAAGTGKRAMLPPKDPGNPSPRGTQPPRSRSESGTSNPPSTAETGNSRPSRQEVRGRHLAAAG